jgi:hypothetical protein
MPRLPPLPSVSRRWRNRGGCTMTLQRPIEDDVETRQSPHANWKSCASRRGVATPVNVIVSLPTVVILLSTAAKSANCARASSITSVCVLKFVIVLGPKSFKNTNVVLPLPPAAYRQGFPACACRFLTIDRMAFVDPNPEREAARQSLNPCRQFCHWRHLTPPER